MLVQHGQQEIIATDTFCILPKVHCQNGIALLERTGRDLRPVQFLYRNAYGENNRFLDVLVLIYFGLIVVLSVKTAIFSVLSVRRILSQSCLPCFWSFPVLSAASGDCHDCPNSICPLGPNTPYCYEALTPNTPSCLKRGG